MLGGVLVCLFLGSVMVLAVNWPPGGGEAPVWLALAMGGAGATLFGALAVLARPWRSETLRRRGVIFFILAYGGVFFSAMAQRLAGNPEPPTGAASVVIPTLCWQGGVLVLVGRMIREHGMDWSAAFGFNRDRTIVLGVGAGLALAAIPALWTLQFLAVKGLTLLGWTPQVQRAVDVFVEANSWPERGALALITLMLAPLCEEVLFRGILYPALKQTGRRHLAFWAAAGVFALVHFHLETFLPLLAFACLLNVLYDRTGNLLACVAAHSMFNGVNLAAILVMQRWFPEQVQM